MMTSEQAQQLRKQYSDRYEYFCLCADVSKSRGKPYERLACLSLRITMTALGYPSDPASWDDERTLMYADNIVAMG
jgi:hypothetical protein